MSEFAHLTGFRREILAAIAALEAEPGQVYGQAIKGRLEERLGEEVLHGRLYPNLDELVECGLVEKSAIDDRSNRYLLADGVREQLAEEGWRLVHLAEDLALEDGGTVDGSVRTLRGEQ